MKEFTMTGKDFDELMDHVFELYCNLQDTEDKSLIAAVKYFKDNYRFEIDVLPQKVYDVMIQIEMNDAKESYYDDKIMEMEDEYCQGVY